jgi:hypothetical protein
MKKTIEIKISTLIIALLSIVSLGFGASSWVAKIDGKTINKNNLTQMLNQQELLAEIGNGRSLTSQFKNKKFQRQILELQIMQQLMVNEIKDINKTKHFISEADIQKDKLSLSNQIEKALWLKAYTDKILRPQISVTQQAIDNFYTQNKKQFNNVPKAEANAYIKEELTLDQIQPLMLQLQKKVRSESNVTINEQFFN